MKTPLHRWLSLALLGLGCTAQAQIAITTGYTQDFNSLGTALPAGWGVWTNSTATSNGSAFTWNTTPVANNAAASTANYFRNLPGAGQIWSAGLSSGSDRALAWRAGDASSRDGSITFSLTNTAGYNFNGLSFQLFTPNSAGTAGTFQLQYQIGTSGTFTQLASTSYTNNPAQNPLTLTTITLTGAQLSVLNNQSGQVTFRLDNTATTGTSWNTLAIDNFSYTASATAIPEPSTYAAILGVVSLAGVLIRRRRLQRVA
ncbi:PEP-CTERM sorting domain-containing protein [Opitutus sp. GAS368]|uniref:PEP-CTERM sorting domain-containing protein n=1 Tax=Opitutus sp. GAS368 TaxID=1882749 RepID=UPI00087C37F4|nr:PEP-CTERM sorting domain-containing protein [Opitutus sp. GAS368]SDR87310.1 hypothetical protein SAMN05444173_1179 [Opitutus sp. GAS368]